MQALKNQLAPKCHVCRNGKWQDMPAKNLVPGDLIEVRGALLRCSPPRSHARPPPLPPIIQQVKLGDVVPADAVLLAGQSLQVDQAALTGEGRAGVQHASMLVLRTFMRSVSLCAQASLSP